MDPNRKKIPSVVLRDFHNFKACVTLWKCTVLPANQSWYVTCYEKGVADLFLYSHVTQGPWHIFIYVFSLCILGPGGLWSVGVNLIWTARSYLKPQAFIGSLPPACNETINKNREDVNTYGAKRLKFCVFTKTTKTLLSVGVFHLF